MDNTPITHWASGHADALALTALALTAIIALSALAWRTRHLPLSRRLLPMSVLVTTGLSGEGMWVVAGQVLHLSGPVRVALFAFGEIVLLSAAFTAQEALARLLDIAGQLDRTGPDSGHDRSILEAARTAVRRRARQFTALVWVIAGGIGVAAASIGTSPAETAIRLAPPLIVAWIWYAQLDRTGLAVTRESITSRLSWRRAMVRLGLADPGRVGLEDADRTRRLDRLAEAAYAHHTARHAKALRSWRLDRAGRAARRYLDPDGMATVQRRLSARYTLVRATSPDALSGLDPWTDSARTVRSVRPRVIPGEVTGQRTDAVRSAPDRTAIGPADGQPGPDTTPGRPDADNAMSGPTGPVRPVTDLADARSARTVRSADVHAMAEWLAGQHPHGIPGRGVVSTQLRERFGSCSTERAIAVMAAARQLTTQEERHAR